MIATPFKSDCVFSWFFVIAMSLFFCRVMNAEDVDAKLMVSENRPWGRPREDVQTINAIKQFGNDLSQAGCLSILDVQDAITQKLGKQNIVNWIKLSYIINYMWFVEMDVKGDDGKTVRHRFVLPYAQIDHGSRTAYLIDPIAFSCLNPPDEKTRLETRIALNKAIRSNAKILKSH